MANYSTPDVYSFGDNGGGFFGNGFGSGFLGGIIGRRGVPVGRGHLRDGLPALQTINKQLKWN